MTKKHISQKISLKNVDQAKKIFSLRSKAK